MQVYFSQLEGSIRLKSCLASLGCPMPAKQLEGKLPMSAMWNNLYTAWKRIGFVDQGLVFVFTPLLLYLVWKVRRLENVQQSGTGTVNVVVSAPMAIPLQQMNPAPAPPPAPVQEPSQSKRLLGKEFPYHLVFHTNQP